MTNKQLTTMVIVLITMVLFMAIAMANVFNENIAQAKVLDAVDSYINTTADTGEMDEFLESPAGVEFRQYYYGE